MNGLEERDQRSGRWVLYKSAEQHSSDCEKYPFESIPKRVFLDTNVVNALVKHGEQIFERQSLCKNFDQIRALDVEALMHIFTVGTRANWDLVASSKTLDELRNTPNDELREDLIDYAICLVKSEGKEASHARDLGRRVLDSGYFEALPGRADRELLAHAIGLGCDVFCTCDRNSIIRKRDRLPALPIRILTPVEWWRHVKPWAGLWC